MFGGPMTLIMTVVLAVCLLLGISILISAYSTNSGKGRCPRCRQANRKQAKYCGRCGTPLSE